MNIPAEKLVCYSELTKRGFAFLLGQYSACYAPGECAKRIIRLKGNYFTIVFRRAGKVCGNEIAEAYLKKAKTVYANKNIF